MAFKEFLSLKVFYFTTMKKIITIAVMAVATLCSAHAAKVVKILAIGNSFSEDAIEQNLHEIAAADGIATVIGNLYIPGCSLQRHAQNIANDAPAYRYRKIGEDGKMQQTDSMRLSKALSEEQWDYVSVQQASHFSGMYNTYEPWLHQVVAYVRAHVGKHTKIVFHQTWAYAKDSSHDGFKNYGRNQNRMYQAICLAAQKAMKAEGIKTVIPCGTAVQNARTSSLGDTMNRDGYHLNLHYGRYTAACTWFEALFGKSVLGNSYTPPQVTPLQKRIAQQAAHEAAKDPWKVTTIHL